MHGANTKSLLSIALRSGVRRLILCAKAPDCAPPPPTEAAGSLSCIFENRLPTTPGSFCLKLARNTQAGPRNRVQAPSSNQFVALVAEAIITIFNPGESGLKIADQMSLPIESFDDHLSVDIRLELIQRIGQMLNL
jgi:hypothetical protein